MEDPKPKSSKKNKVVGRLAKATGRAGKKAIKHPVARYVIGLLVVVLVGYGIFVLGEHRGAKRQEVADAKKRTNLLSNRTPQSAKLPDGQTRKTILGTVIKASTSSLDVKAKTSGTNSTVAIDSKTVITGTDGKKTDAKALKNDQSVIISGIADKNGKVTAQRIRIQK